MKLDKDTYHLAQDIYLRAVTNPNYKGGSESQTAKNSIQQSVTFFGQWESTQAQVSAAATQAVETTRPVIVPPKPVTKPANGGSGNDRQKLSKAPPKPLRVKAKKPAAKQLRVKAKKSKR
jgi:hypothetical protein